MLERFRGVVWRRNNPDPPGVYRYIVAGLLVTDRPIPEHEGPEFGHRTMVDGPAFGLADALAGLRQREATMNLGDASSVLLCLDALLPDDEP